MASESSEKKIMIKVDEDLKEKFKMRMDEYSKDKDFSKSLRAAMANMIIMDDKELDSFFALADGLAAYTNLWDSQKVIAETKEQIPGAFNITVNPTGAYGRFWKTGKEKAFLKLESFFNKMTDEL